MKKIEEGKKSYEKIEIPSELKGIVESCIAEDRKKKEGEFMMKKRTKVWYRVAGLAAGFVIVFTAGLNTSEAFAKSMSDMPILGVIAEVLTLRSYEEQKDNVNISVDVPKVESNTTVAATDNSTGETWDAASGQPTDQTSFEQLQKESFLGDINAEIEKFTAEYVERATKEIEDYKEAFLATGGTEQEWRQRDVDIKVDYEVKHQQGAVVSFVINAYESSFAFSQTNWYYNIDLENDRRLTLEDILGEGYTDIANESIIKQMKERAEAEGYIYWGITDTGTDGMEMQGFTTVDENTSFYINEAGNPVVCFDKYSVGPGYMGIQEFEIVK